MSALSFQNIVVQESILLSNRRRWCSVRTLILIFSQLLYCYVSGLACINDLLSTEINRLADNNSDGDCTRCFEMCSDNLRTLNIQTTNKRNTFISKLHVYLQCITTGILTGQRYNIRWREISRQWTRNNRAVRENKQNPILTKKILNTNFKNEYI